MRPPQPSGLDAAPQHGTHRLFFALWPDPTLRQRIEEVTTVLAAAHGTQGRRTAPERYHLTLQFLGDFGQPQSVIDNAVAAADSVRMAGFELQLDRSGSFGGTRVGWLGPAGVTPALQHLWDALGLALEAHGVTPKSAPAWTPHVTVLRNMRRPLPAAAIPPLSWPVDGFVLVESRPGQGTYVELQRWPLPAATCPGVAR